MNTIKLQKFISQAGVSSRRAAEKLILAGKVMVNDRPAKIGDRMDPTQDQVKIDGKLIELDQDKVYFLINKPVGLISTSSDELNRSNVLSLLPRDITQKHRLYPVGRLDKDSEGLMLLTNDGDLAQKLTHPKFEIPKTYRVLIDRKPTYKAIQHLRRGVRLKDGMTQPALVKIEQDELEDRNDHVWLQITISEGRNHQLRRMLERVGYDVIKLVRIKLGPFELDQLGSEKFLQVDAPNL